jgi:hypothetical protein
MVNPLKSFFRPHFGSPIEYIQGDVRDPAPRKRALTIPLTAPMRQTTQPQDQSPLFTKLPDEIRLQIWEACIGGNVISLQMVNELRPARAGLIALFSGGPERKMRQGASRRATCFTEAEIHTSMLPLLLTCRKVYVPTLMHPSGASLLIFNFWGEKLLLRNRHPLFEQYISYVGARLHRLAAGVPSSSAHRCGSRDTFRVDDEDTTFFYWNRKSE